MTYGVDSGRRGMGFLRRRGRRSGFALLIVLFVTILLAVSVAGYALGTRTSRGMAAARAESVRLLFAARGAVEESKAVLWRQYVDGDDNGDAGIWMPPEPLDINIGGVFVRVYFEDEAAKIPINDFATGENARRSSLARALARLFKELGLPNSTSLAASVRDFIGGDKERLTGGSGAKRLFHVSELAGVKGFDAGGLYNVGREGVPSAASCMSTFHRGRVNVNTASRLVLSCVAPRLTAGELDGIIAAREERVLAGGEDFGRRVGISEEAGEQLSKEVCFASDVFTLRVEARSGAFFRRVTAVVRLDSSAAHTLYFGEGWDF